MSVCCKRSEFQEFEELTFWVESSGAQGRACKAGCFGDSGLKACRVVGFGASGFTLQPTQVTVRYFDYTLNSKVR